MRWRSQRSGSPPVTIAPSGPTNLTLHQAVDINVPIGCGDAPIWPGDVMVGDADGMIVILAAIAEQIAQEAVEMTACKNSVTERVRAGATIVGFYPATLAAFARWRA